MLRLQRLAGNAAVTSRLLPLQRISYDRCEVREGDVRIAHNRAKNLVNNTIRKLRAYDGSQADVRGALSQHFHGTSQIVAFAVANHLTSVMLFVDWAQYECHEDETNGSALASTIWCVPFTDISLWKPWFTLALDDQANTIAHEWMHKYDCAFDLGYDYEEIYRQSGTIRALLNAEPYGNLVAQLGR